LVNELDLASYQVKEREPLVGTYENYTVISAPPPSSGGIALTEILNILEGYDLRSFGVSDSHEIHLVTEAYRRAFMDRSDYLGDPDYIKVPVEQLTSKKYAAAWRATIQADKATPSASLKRPVGFLPVPPETSGVHRESTQTTHYSVVDAQGDAVAVTTTLKIILVHT
jgi:gamma-glutamyltranspeptidase/glutathione hydrolase